MTNETKNQIKKLHKLFDRLINEKVAGNMQAGATYPEAKEVVFNMFNETYPELFNLYLNTK